MRTGTGNGGGSDQGQLPGTSRRSGGRKNQDGTEETIKVKPLKERCPRLLKLYGRAQDALTEYKEALKLSCEETGANSAQVNKLIRASHKGNFEDVRRKVEQEAIIFEAVGEVSASGE